MPAPHEIEYQELRATIRERGSLRMWAILVGLFAWGVLAMVLIATDGRGGITMVPFLVLAATFEISFFIHIGIERIGRYIQVFHEESSGSAGWETTAMNYGRNFPGGLDPLFITLFALSAGANYLSSLTLTTRRPGWVVVSVIAHLAFGWRLVIAKRLAANQRATDLERFRGLKKSN